MSYASSMYSTRYGRDSSMFAQDSSSYFRDDPSYRSSYSPLKYTSNQVNGYSSARVLDHGHTSMSRSSLRENPRIASLTSSTALRTKYDIQSSLKYSTNSKHLSSRTGRTTTRTDDIVRPSMRSRNTSLSRDVGRSKREVTRAQSFTRAKDNREYPDLSSKYGDTAHKSSLSSETRNHISRRQPSPARTARVPVPEFQDIKSDYNKTRRNGTKTTRSPSLTNGSRASQLNGHSSQTAIETKRTIHRSPLDDSGYSPSFAQNRTGNNNKGYGSSAESSRSSAGSKRDEIYENGDAEISSSSSSRDFPDINAGLVGLKNIGNTCFMNSILQCLSNTRLLRDYCYYGKYRNDINRTSSPMKGGLVEAFLEIIRQLWHPSSSGSPVSTTSFKSQIQKFSKRFSGYEQQDSQEFLRFLIEGLHEDVNHVSKKPKNPMPNFDSLCDESKAKKTWDFYLSKDKSYIVDLFMGQLKSSLECAECKHVSTTFDPFWDLSLPLPKASYRDTDLQCCLDNFTREEILEGDERPTCDKCKARRRMTKKFTIYKFPRVLVIHLKRFSEGQRFRQKLSSRVDFPHRLEITSPVSVSPATFNLYAVSNHSGSCYGGHYTAYCKNPETTKWNSFNDSLVSAMSQSSVQSKEAYVLFYEMSTRNGRSHL